MKKNIKKEECNALEWNGVRCNDDDSDDDDDGENGKVENNDMLRKVNWEKAASTTRISSSNPTKQAKVCVYRGDHEREKEKSIFRKQKEEYVFLRVNCEHIRTFFRLNIVCRM